VIFVGSIFPHFVKVEQEFLCFLLGQELQAAQAHIPVDDAAPAVKVAENPVVPGIVRILKKSFRNVDDILF